MELFGTLGPACADETILFQMFSAGMTGLRLNLSHRSLRESRDWLCAAKKAAARTGKQPKLLMDLQGPELRVGRSGFPLDLKEGSSLPLEHLVLPAPLKELLRPGQELLLDDGKLQVRVIAPNLCKVLRGGLLLPKKTVAAPGLQVDLPALTNEDLENISLAHEMGITDVMQSFVRGREDLVALRGALDACGGEKIRIFAKIENLQGLNSLPDWIDLADCIVIARGDLGNAMPLWQLPAAQKNIAKICIHKKKPFLVVTQMLASMEHRAIPTRAEVSDIFNAVLDGASALMLTGETASGSYPVQAMEYLNYTAQEALQFMNE